MVQARADRANARLLLIRADDAYAVARAELNRAMGTVGDTDYDVADDNFPPVPGEDGALGPLIDEGVRARPELAALDAQIGAQELALRAAKGGYWPSLSFVAGASAGIQFQQTRMLDNLNNVVPYGGLAWNLFAGFKLTWGICQGFATRGEVHEAGAVLDGLRAQRDGALHQVWVAVQRSALGVRAAKEALTVGDEALASERERLRLAEGRYGAGVGKASSSCPTPSSVRPPRAARSAAAYALAAARADLWLALGALTVLANTANAASGRRSPREDRGLAHGPHVHGGAGVHEVNQVGLDAIVRAAEIAGRVVGGLDGRSQTSRRFRMRWGRAGTGDRTGADRRFRAGDRHPRIADAASSAQVATRRRGR